METDKMSTASSVGAAERRPLLQALVIERRILFACTILIGLCTFVWITAVCTEKWVHIDGGKGVYLPARGRYLLWSDSGLWQICRFVFEPNTTVATRQNASLAATTPRPYDIEGMSGQYLTRCTNYLAQPVMLNGLPVDKAYDVDNAISEHESKDDVGQIGKDVSTAATTVDRDEYLQAHRDLTFDRNQLQLKNNLLHRRMAEYYRKRKLDHVLKALEGSQDLEEKYQQKLISYEELKEKEEREMSDIRSKIQAVEVLYEGKLENAEKKFHELQTHERSTGSGLIYSKKGKPIADKTVERFLNLQKRKLEQASALRLRYIRARNAVSELEATIRNLEKLGPGLYVAHYEQLHIDNQNLMTKIEDREDELIRNRGKCTEHNQILAHIREKMHHTDEVIDFTECDLGDAEIEFYRAREDLGQVKTRRDRLRWSLENERIKAGLLTKKELLRDFQNATNEVVKLREKKAELEQAIEQKSNKLREARKQMQVQRLPDDVSGDL